MAWAEGQRINLEFMYSVQKESERGDEGRQESTITLITQEA